MSEYYERHNPFQESQLPILNVPTIVLPRENVVRFRNSLKALIDFAAGVVGTEPERLSPYHLTSRDIAGKRPELLPAEHMTLTMAKRQAEEGRDTGANAVLMLCLTIERLTGRSDWTQE